MTSWLKIFILIGILPFIFWQHPVLAQDRPDQKALDQLNKVIAEVEARIRQTSEERSDVEKNLQDTEKKLAETSAGIRQINLDIAQAETRLVDLEDQQISLDQSRQEQQALIGQYLTNAWKSGKEEYLKVLLNQQGIDKTARTMRYYQYFNKARAGKITEFETTLEELNTVEIAIRQTRESMQASRTELQSRQTELDSQQLDRRRILDQLSAVLAESGTELARLQREREEMTLLVEELNRAAIRLDTGINNNLPFAQLKGELSWPLDGPLLNQYGDSYELGDLDWQGVTIAGNEGEGVRAIHQGRVVFSDWFASSGLLLIIDHGGGYMSLYAHNQLLYKNVGDRVDSGEIIAAVGNTGGRSENGVYFEIRYNGDSVDPAGWMTARN